MHSPTIKTGTGYCTTCGVEIPWHRVFCDVCLQINEAPTKTL